MTTFAVTAPIRLDEPDAVRITGLRNLRYGEVLLVRTDDGRYVAEIWNSMGLNDCPQDAWDALDPAAIARDHGALAAVKNGPRHWLLDVIENVPRADRRVESFGTIDMTLVATLELGDEIPRPQPYVERSVRRDTVWEWSAGRTVHELVDPTGRVFTMQAYCIGVDPTLAEASLDGLADRLALPDGWTYRSRTLDEALCLQAPDGVATIIQDDLQNTYMA